MISFFFLVTLKELFISGTSRIVIPLLLFAGWCFFIAKRLHKRNQRQRKRWGSILLTSCLVIEALGCVLMLLPAKTVSLQYVGVYPTLHQNQSGSEVDWDVVYFSDEREPSLAGLEQYFEAELNGLVLDTDHYSYLFVYGKKDVRLQYSMWDLEFNNKLPPNSYFFWGHLSTKGKTDEGVWYVFRFKKAPILRYGLF